MDKHRLNLTIGILVTSIIAILTLLFIALSKYLATHEVILLLLFPVLIAIVTQLISENGQIRLINSINEFLEETKIELKNDLNTTKESLKESIDTNRYICYGGKYDVPNRSEFWNNFLLTANSRFLLIGKTNQSWVTGGRSQSQTLSNGIIKILENGGEVRLISDSKESTIRNNLNFLKVYVIDEINKMGNSEKRRLKERIKSNLSYCTRDNLNYTAVVSDSRLIILPRLNDESKQEKSMVLEINQANYEIYKNYMDDIETILINSDTIVLDDETT